MSDPDTDPDAPPPGHHGEVNCYSCGQPGYLMEFDEVRGFLIAHPGRMFPCRAPAEPPEAPAGELVVPVEISEN